MLAHITIIGPVGILAAVLLITAPVMPAIAPKKAARQTMNARRLVHWRAAEAGATTMALISTTPTACRPITIAITISVISGVLERLSDQKPNQVVAVTKNIDRLKLTAPPEFAGAYDPHVWFDVTLWTNVAETIRSALVKLMPSAEAHFQTRAKKYILQLEDLHIYVKEKATQIEASKRVLVTAHDAFGYFGQAYGFEVRGLQGISTATEAGTADVRNLAQFIADRKIPAIFVESSVPRQSIEAVQAAVQARKFEVQIGGELFSDAMGNPDTKEGTYIGMVQHNIDTIFDGLTGNN